ncbi:hypothetical protein E1091_01305 [Micromonospora fluostatini]|uniref:Uncharacterized protein n=1 Tax=Micromonospora fluostatini TaxID=1629071 RepID=A0ABY2DLN0_9ACTN|nr:hypothetical protein E1091_01305 [Micromonospora fluostatini]
MAGQHDDVLVHVAAPEAAPGTLRIIGKNLAEALTNLVAVPAAGKNAIAASRYVWIYAEGRRLVGTATDLAAVGQADAPTLAGNLPLLGLAPGDAKKLAAAARRAPAAVTLATAGDELTCTTGVDTAARVPLRVPGAVELDVLAEAVRQLDAARSRVDTSALPHGCALINTALLAKFPVIAAPAGGAKCWILPAGQIYLEVNQRFRGYVKGAGSTSWGARRHLPAGQVLPAIPARSAA